MNDDYFPQDRGYQPKKKYESRVARDIPLATKEIMCANPDCRGHWRPSDATYGRGYGDIAIHLNDRTIYVCQKCYIERLIEVGKSQAQIAEQEYGLSIRAKGKTA